jgi:hypothetical protein
MITSCCCSSCTYFIDSFNRTDSTTLGTDWTEVSGDWEIDTNKLKVTGTDAILLWTGEMPTAADLIVNAQLTTRSNGDKVRLIADYIDDDNYVCFEYEYVSTYVGYMRIIDRVAGAETIDREITIASSNPNTPIARLVLTGGRLLGYLDEGAGSVVEGVVSPNRTFTSAKVGIGTGDTFTAGKIADWFRVETPGDAIYTEDSNGSHSGLPTKCRKPITLNCPDEATATVDLTAGQVDPCVCATLNGQYAVDIWGFHGPSNNNSQFYTAWRYDFGGTVCGANYIYMEIFTNTGGPFCLVSIQSENRMFNRGGFLSVWQFDDSVVCGTLIGGTGSAFRAGPSNCIVAAGTTVDFP